MDDIFKCKMCGNCCRNIRGRTERTSLPPLPSFVFKAVPLSLMTIGLQEWEISTLRERAEQFSVDLKIKADSILWDQNTETPIATQWNLDHDDCPFLSTENKCRIYDKRPLICQAYPLEAFGLLSLDHESKKSISYGDCSNVVPIRFPENTLFRVRPKELFHELFRVYGSSFLGMLRLDSMARFYHEAIYDSIQAKIINPVPINKEIKKAILRGKPIGLLEFLKKRDPERAKNLRSAIDSLYEFDMQRLERLLKT